MEFIRRTLVILGLFVGFLSAMGGLFPFVLPAHAAIVMLVTGVFLVILVMLYSSAHAEMLRMCKARDGYRDQRDTCQRRVGCLRQMMSHYMNHQDMHRCLEKLARDFWAQRARFIDSVTAASPQGNPEIQKYVAEASETFEEYLIELRYVGLHISDDEVRKTYFSMPPDSLDA